ncbi:response regulator transcription factor [Agarilytica rhodophyticola]|uniref:response regulator transcription factor n=1 Tax=Agarilytica rhodophyticola TaxID=1737490 RepID=UPI001FE2FF5C|nr:response regulator [Agarilytica rhodophyticola]
MSSSNVSKCDSEQLAKNILLVEDDETLGHVTKLALEKKGYSVSHVKTVLDAQNTLHKAPYGLAILDLKLEDETSLDLLPILKRHNEHIKVLVLTAYASIATAVEAVKRGAHNYLPKPATVQEILAALEEQEVADSNKQEDMSIISTKRLEWEHIQRSLLRNDGNVSATARELNMHRRTLQRKLQKYPVKE